MVIVCIMAIVFLLIQVVLQRIGVLHQIVMAGIKQHVIVVQQVMVMIVFFGGLIIACIMIGVQVKISTVVVLILFLAVHVQKLVLIMLEEALTVQILTTRCAQ